MMSKSSQPAPTGFDTFGLGLPVPEKYRKAVPFEGGGALELGNKEFTILTALPGMRAREAQAIRKSPMELGILPCGDALFLVCRVDGYATLDMPYDHRLVPADRRGLFEERQPHQGVSILVLAWELTTGVTKGLRTVSVTPKFCNVLEAELARLDRRVDAPDWHYAADVRQAYARYPRPDDMLAASVHREVAGRPFPQEGK